MLSAATKKKSRPAPHQAHRALERRLLAEIDPNNTLDPDERLRLLNHARREHFRRLS